MKRHSCLPNPFGQQGFLLGWEPAFLGNCLTSLANLVAFAVRTGVPVIYPQIDEYRNLFEDPGKSRSVFDPAHVLDHNAVEAFVQAVGPAFDGYFPAYTERVATIDHASLAQYPSACGTTMFLPYTTTQQIVDWSDGDAEAAIARFCRQGAGLVLPGAFWTQVTDMRATPPLGPPLREHVGRLRSDHHPTRGAHMRQHQSSMKIGIHVRQGDYKDWHAGKYYYELSEYVAFITLMHSQMQNIDHMFYIFSNAAFQQSDFNDLPVFFVPGSSLDDFATLGRCDIVVGPPSTFATWSSFLGSAKRLILTRERLAQDNGARVIDWAIDIPFPTGAYLPGDVAGKPI